MNKKKHYSTKQIHKKWAKVKNISGDRTFISTVLATLRLLPKNIVDKSMKFVFYIEIKPDDVGFYYHRELIKNRDIIFIDPTKVKEDMDIFYSIMHETAHSVLEHKIYTSLIKDQERKKLEEEADRLVNYWIEESGKDFDNKNSRARSAGQEGTIPGLCP